MKTKLFLATTTAVALAFGALTLPASAQPRPVYRNYGVRVYTPQINVFANPGYANPVYANPYGAYAPYVAPTTSSFSFVTPYRGFSAYATPYGTAYSGYVGNSFPRYLTPYGPVPATYNTYSGWWGPYMSSYNYNPYGNPYYTPYGY